MGRHSRGWLRGQSRGRGRRGITRLARTLGGRYRDGEGGWAAAVAESPAWRAHLAGTIATARAAGPRPSRNHPPGGRYRDGEGGWAAAVAELPARRALSRPRGRLGRGRRGITCPARRIATSGRAYGGVCPPIGNAAGRFHPPNRERGRPVPAAAVAAAGTDRFRDRASELPPDPAVEGASLQRRPDVGGPAAEG
jgi:hypothetical protein